MDQKINILNDSIKYLIEEIWKDKNFLSQTDHVRNRCYDRGEQMGAELVAEIEAARLSIRTNQALIKELKKEIELCEQTSEV